MGEIDEVVAVLDYPFQKMDGESLTRALFRFKSGKVASFDAIMTDSVLGPDPWFHITGTKGEIIRGQYLTQIGRAEGRAHRDAFAGDHEVVEGIHAKE